MTEVSFIKNDISKIINKLNNIVSETESLKSEIQNKFISFETLQDNHNIVIKNIQSNLELNSTNNDKITQLITFKNNVDKDIMDVNQKIYILNDGLNNSCAKFFRFEFSLASLMMAATIKESLLCAMLVAGIKQAINKIVITFRIKIF